MSIDEKALGSDQKVRPNRPAGSARIPPLSIDAVKDKGTTAAAIANASWTWGRGQYFPSNLIKVMAHCPRLAQTEVDYANAVIFDEDSWLNGVQQAGFVDRCLKEMLINAVAATNRCRYSLNHHSFIGLNTFDQAGRRDEYLPKFLHIHEFDVPPHNQNYTALEFALLRYAKKICLDPHTVTDDEFKEMRQRLADYNIKAKPAISAPDNERLINSQIVEVTWLISHFCLLTRWFSVLHVEDEGAENEANFLAFYEQLVPPEIIARNNQLLGTDF